VNSTTRLGVNESVFTFLHVRSAHVIRFAVGRTDDFRARLTSHNTLCYNKSDDNNNISVIIATPLTTGRPFVSRFIHVEHRRNCSVVRDQGFEQYHSRFQRNIIDPTHVFVGFYLLYFLFFFYLTHYFIHGVVIRPSSYIYISLSLFLSLLVCSKVLTIYRIRSEIFACIPTPRAVWYVYFIQCYTTTTRSGSRKSGGTCPSGRKSCRCLYIVYVYTNTTRRSSATRKYRINTRAHTWRSYTRARSRVPLKARRVRQPHVRSSREQHGNI